MGYDNTATLKVITTPTITTPVKICIKCNSIYKDSQINFCSKDGQKLEYTFETSEVSDIIPRFRKTFEMANLLLNDIGESSGMGYSNAFDIVDELKKFTNDYSDGLFQVDITWDQGFGDPPSRYYIQNGKSQECNLQMIYDDFDFEKLK
jgi:hypothetical protein